MKRNYLLIAAFLFSFTALAQIDTINQRVFLIGDGGELVGNTHPVIDWLKKNVDWNDERNTAIFLGDNIYPLGLPMEGEPTYEESKKVIDYQMSLVKGKKAKAYFIPGNHDWKNGKLGGWQQVINQVNYINGQQQANIQAWPLEGCPGPIEVELSDKVVVVMIDSQWFLYVHEKPGPTSTCSAKTLEEVVTELNEIVATHPNQLLILAMHHPIYSYGPHGGDYTWKNHLFPFLEANPKLYVPLPVLGSIYPIARGVFGNLQDTRHPLYRTMARELETALRKHPNPIAVAGHEHSLQLIMRDSVPFIVSGSAAELTRVKPGKDVLFSEVSYGFAVIEVRKSGKVETKFYTLASANMSAPVFTAQLKTLVPTEPKGSLDTLLPLIDTVLVAANANLKGNRFKYFFQGRNYRAEWTQPVRVPMLDLGTEMGGLTPLRQGGGKQTKSLRLQDKSGKEWALRSIEKFPEGAIPPDLRRTIARDIVEDGVSASYPYGSLSIAPIAAAAGVPPIRRKLVYVPDDPRLDRFRTEFKNTLAILEEREPVNVKKTDNTDELILKLAKDNDDHVDQKRILKARLMDNFIMDFDRHEDQWRWATYDTGKGKMYYPITKDHDQAFFTNQGLLPRFVRKPWIIPEIQGFRAVPININTFNRPARNFDRFFLNELSAEDWRRQIDTFLANMTDEVITESLMRQPREVQQFSAPGIIKTLKQKRESFAKTMMGYYEFISKEVNIVGSNQRELFTLTKHEDGAVNVIVNKIEKTGVVTSKIYERLFDPAVTKELRIYGLEDDDSFVVKGNNSKIKIRIIGGPGKDHFTNSSSGKKVLAYDANFEENTFNGNFKDKTSGDPQVNRYNRLEYKYDFVNPGVAVEYNIDDGLYLGAEFEATLRGFRKEPYAARHYIRANRALATGSYHFRYDGDFIKAIGNSDIVIRGDFRAPVNVTNFFGIGNNTVYDQTKPGDIQYYRSRYDVVDLSVLLRRQLQSWMRVSIGPTFQYINLNPENNKGKFVSDFGVNGLDPATAFQRKAYVGAEGRLDINSKNNQALPTRGAVITGYARQLMGLNDFSHNVTQTGLDISIFMSLVPETRIVFGTRFGVGHNLGKFEFPQAQYLSGNTNLRGFRKDRFAGRTMVFNNSELRLKLMDFTTYLFPGSLGILGFHDIGRVWADNENSLKWHNGYGAGVWVAPIKRFVITASVARSQEHSYIPYVTFGFQF